MKTVTITYLEYQNFMGARETRWDFDGRSGCIRGGNGTGKTTVYHAFTWLLFGRDSRGRKEFDLKPHGADGAVLDRGAVTSVEAALTVDGTPLTLRRTYFELWTTRRGSRDEKFDGHSSEFYINGVPSLKKEYDARVQDIAGEELFRALTDVRAFAEALDWRKRRALLLELCGLPGDLDLMDAEPSGRFTELAARCGNLSPEDYKKVLLARRKQINGAQNSIPARLDEQQKNVAALSGTDFAALRAARTAKEAEAERTRGELSMLEHGALSTSKRNEMAEKETALRELEARNREHRLEQRAAHPAEPDRRGALKAECDRALRDSAALADRIIEAQAAIPAYQERSRELAGELEDRLARLREDWTRADQALAALPDPEADTDGDWSRCPTCGQPLPPDQLEAAKARRRAQHEEALTFYERRREQAEADAAEARETEARGQERLQSMIASEQERLTRLLAQKRESDARLSEARAALRDYVPPEEPVIDDLPEYAERRAALEAEARQLRTELAQLEGDTESQRRALREKLSRLRTEADALDRELAMEAQLDFARRRCDELREEARKVTEEIEDVDKMLALCEEFTRYKVRFVEDGVNSQFPTVRFRLFAEQVNGGLADCCDVLISGSRFGAGANTGSEMAAGLEIIDVLSHHYGISVPVFVDGCESVEKLPAISGQVIRLEVDKVNRALRFVAD